VQERFLRAIPGLEEVEIVRYGYAVEYDYVPPTQLRPTLEARAVRGLYLAGQLNGTSGYEEAAFQGLWAGVNAALAVKGEPEMVLGRHEAHGAVLVDELVSKGVDEPFRMLTSRSEHRLRLREGNADVRLRRHGHRLGLVSEEDWAATAQKEETVKREVERIKERGLDSRLRRPEETYASIAHLDATRPKGIPDEVASEVEIEVKYEGYIRHAEKQWARAATEQDGWEIPAGLLFSEVRGLSAEVTEKLNQHRPATVGQARRIPGMTPASLSLLCIHLKRWSDAHAAAATGESCG
jgi:tRNA uridine 5-carboxymethylaminomethyl modification enzyme